MNLISDFINFSFIFVVLLLVLTKFKFGALKSLLILFHLFSILIFNGVLFPASYFSDQFNYYDTASLIRETFPVDMIKYHILHRTPHYVAGTMFAVFPLPFIASIYSLAMINFLIYLFIIIYMKKRNINSNYVDFFFLLYPSLMLYSSLALREIFILLFMFLVFYHILITRKYSFAILYWIPLFLLKYQNALIIVLSLPLYLFLRNNTKFKLIILTLLSSATFYIIDYIPLVNMILEKVEYYRYYMFLEDSGYDWSIVNFDNYTELKRGVGLLFQVIFGSLYFLSTPLPWEVTNPMQIIQCVENIILLSLILYLHSSEKFLPVIKKQIIFLNSFIFIAASIYGLVVFNYGAIARYRFALFTVYFIFLLYFYYYNKKLKKLKFFNNDSSVTLSPT